MSSGKAKRLRLNAARVSSRTQNSNTLAEQQQLVTEESHNFRIAEPTGGASTNTIFTVFHIKEAKADVERRILASRQPVFYSTNKRYADSTLYSQVVPIPLRPAWNNKLSREELHANEMEKFEDYLKVIYDNIPPSRLTHFEHNLNVWRQLWRVCEMSDLLCVTVDSRHPLFHFPPALYDYIVNKLKKPMLLVLNKVDLVPLSILKGWVRYLEKCYPEVHIVPFTSHPNPESVTGEEGSIDSILTRDQRRATGAGAIHKSHPVGSVLLKSFWNILASKLEECEGELTNAMVSKALEYTRKLGYISVLDLMDEEDQTSQDGGDDTTTTTTTTTPGNDSDDDESIEALTARFKALLVSQDDEQVLMQRIRHRYQLKQAQKKEAEELKQHQEQQPADAKESITSHHENDSDHDDADDDDDDLANADFLLNLAKDSDDEGDNDGDHDDDDDDSFDYHAAADRLQQQDQPRRHLTVGMVGHPNAGKSSLINAILGRPAVSVSSAPGHTKHLQTLSSVPNCPGVKLCDCPGLVFPAVDVSRSLQTLLGIFPYPRLTEPYTCVQFLAERLPLIDLYNLSPYLGEESDAKLYGASTPGGVSAFIEDHHIIMLETDYTGDDTPEEKQMGLLCSVSTDTHHSLFLPGTLTTQLPEAYRALVKRRTQLNNTPANTTGAVTNIDATNQDGPATPRLVVNGIDIASLAPTRPTKGKKNTKKGAKSNDKSNLAAITGLKKHNNNKRHGDGNEEDIYNNLDELFSDTQLDPTTHPRFVWSAYRICESLAQRRGWFKEGGRPDCFRAGMSIVKDCVEGRLNLYFYPPKTA